MELTPEDMQALGDLIDKRVKQGVAEATAVPVPEDSPDVAERKKAEPWYFVHLADGRVIETQDSASTVMEDMAVIGRFPSPRKDTEE